MYIVVVDKSKTILTKIETLLHEIGIEDLDIRLFSDADNALDFIDENEVKLLFSSIETDGIDGITFIETVLRKDPELTSKIFIVTSQKDGENFNDIKGVGAKRFIQKPINEKHFKHFVTPEITKILNY